MEHVGNDIADLDRRGYVRSAVARCITVACNIHRFLIAEDLGSTDPTSIMPAVRRPRKLPLVLSIAETEALLETAHKLAAPRFTASIRDSALPRYRLQR